ncbi:hypothetical protein [Pseudomonas sp. NyZ201]|uniref:hypothetical protein n=1 Tax=Pseudomonas sp. NyZ201 TaxID=3409857 RepID=UPI003CFB18BE
MNDVELVSRHYPVEEDMTLQQRVWRFERVGWYVLVLIVLLALAGLFGNGPLSDADATSADGRVRVEYQRLSRSGTTDSMRIQVRGTPGQPVQLLLGGSLLREASIETLQPEPLSAQSRGEEILMRLGTGEDGIATLYLTLRSEHVGRLEGRVGLGQGSTTTFSTFFFP